MVSHMGITCGLLQVGPEVWVASRWVEQIEAHAALGREGGQKCGQLPPSAETADAAAEAEAL